MNKKFISSILATIMIVTTCLDFKLVAAESTSNYDLNDSLLGYYTFDDDSVSNLTVNNLAEAGDVYDGKLGSLSNANSTNITKDTGILGNGLKFDGTESYFRVPNVINAKTDYTVSLWLYNDKSQPTDAASINIIQQTGVGRTLLYLKNKKYGSFVPGRDIIESNVEDYGKWQNVIITSKVNDNNTITFKIYVDGELRKEELISDASTINGGITNLQFGCHKNTNTGYSLKGVIDTVRIYNKTADSDMINELFSEHKNVIVFEKLRVLINSATELLENGILTDEYEEYTDLYNKVEEVKSITTKSSYDEIMLAKTELEALIYKYNETANNLPVKLSIDYDNVIKSIPDYMFGVNHRYHMDGYGSYNPTSQELYKDFVDLTDSAKFGSIRYPGGIVANLFQWKRSIGDIENRISTIHGNWNEPNITPNFGLDEAARYIIDESNGEMIYVYGFGNGSALDAADLVEYLNCEVGENPNGGIDWAQVRANNGHQQPYNVKMFEIGNEVDEGRGYWMQNSPDEWSGSGLNIATMYAEGATRTFVKEKVAELDNWNTSTDKSKASYFSDGTANQKKYMRYANDVSDQIDKSKAVQSDSVHVYVNNEEWTIVKDIKATGAEDKVIEVNYENGEILFGDGVNGKIPVKDSDIRVSYTVYKDGIADYYDEMKKVDSEIKIYSGYANVNIAQAIAQSPKASKNGGKFDGIAVHPYSHTNNQIQDSDPLFYEKIMEKIETNVITQVRSRENALKTYWTDGSKEVAISEYGIFNHPGDVVQTQTHAIYIAANIIEFMNVNTAYTNKHCLIDFPGGDVLGPGKQALIQSIKQEDGSYKFYGTPSLKVFTILNTMTGNELIKSTLTNNKKFYNNVDAIHTMVSKDEDNIYVLLINMDRNKNVKVNIDVDNTEVKNNKAEVMTLSGDGVYAMNSLENPNNVDVVTSEFVFEPNNMEYDVPAHSVVGIKLALNEEEVIEINKDSLQKLVDRVNNLNKDEYIASTWEALEEELTVALNVLSNKDATQVETDEAYKCLLRVYLNLRLIPDKSKLEGLINKAEKIDITKYTEDSYEVLQEELSRARAVFSNDNASEEEVANAEKSLEIALANLEEKNKDNSNDSSNEDGDTNNSNQENSNSNNGTNSNNQENSLANSSNSNNNATDNSNNTTNNNNHLPNTGGVESSTVGILGLLISVIGIDVFKKRK